MIHKIFCWMGGYVKVRIQGKRIERFVNLCRNRGIILWQLCWDTNQEVLYFRVALKDFYRLRPMARKCKVRTIVVERFGLPFLLGHMQKRASFCIGVSICFLLILFLSTRIWGISVEGQSYHTKESILEYLNSIDVYGGIESKTLECADLEEQIRQKFNDIGWVSVEKKGSKIYIRVREVLLIEKEEEKPPAHLIAQQNGRVVSIVTRSGTAKVKAGDKVKKGDVLISGTVKIYGDNQELIEKKYVHAEGTVVLSVEKNYQDILKKEYQKKVYTGRTKKIYELQIAERNFFCYNPLKNLETFEKYDIIREGGQLCPLLSLRFPVKSYVKTFREITFQKAVYTKKEAGTILKERLDYYLQQKKEAGYRLQKNETVLQTGDSAYQYQGNLVFLKEQKKHKKISKNNNNKNNREKETDGNNGNSN